MIEMTLVGIPLLFVMISIFEMSRLMWVYHTMSHSVREVTRFASLHGQDCAAAALGNNCAGGGTPPDNVTGALNTVGALVQVLEYTGVGIDAAKANLNFYSGPGLFNAGSSSPQALGLVPVAPCTPISVCAGSAQQFPSTQDSVVGLAICVMVTYQVNTALSMFWPGAGSGTVFGPITLGANSQDFMQF